MLFEAEALRLVKGFLDAHHIRYMVIGGIANALWGRLRATEDADVKVLTGGMSAAEFRTLAEAAFKPYRRPWLGAAESALVVSVEVLPGMVTDMLVGILPYEERAIKRAVVMDVEGVQLPVCTAEDLVIHKAIADRHKDWMDIEGILMRQKGKLDAQYVQHWLGQFGEALEKPELAKRFDELYTKIAGD
jgi:hypothetical protein